MAANINVDVIAQGKDFHNDFSGSTQTNCDAASGGNLLHQVVLVTVTTNGE
jgi:hypothetical protein